MTDCIKVLDNISLFLDNELSADERLQVEEHIQKCTICQQECFELQTTIALMRSLELLEPPADFRKRVEQRLLKNKKGRFVALSQLYNNSWFSLGVAAAVLVLIIASWGVLFNNDMPKMFANPSVNLGQVTSDEAHDASEASKAEDFSVALTEVEVSEENIEIAPDTSQKIQARILDDATSSFPAEIAKEALPSTKNVSGDNDEDEKKIEKAQISIAALEIDGVKSKDEESQEPIYTVALMGSEPWVNVSPRIDMEIETEDVGETLMEIEAIVRQNGLKMQAISIDDAVTVEIISPTPKQEKVVERLKGISHVLKEETIKQDVDEAIAELVNQNDTFMQKQSELQSLIQNGGSVEELERWQDELGQLAQKTDEIQKQIVNLEKEQATTLIFLGLVKRNS